MGVYTGSPCGELALFWKKFKVKQVLTKLPRWLPTGHMCILILLAGAVVGRTARDPLAHRPACSKQRGLLSSSL